MHVSFWAHQDILGEREILILFARIRNAKPGHRAR
jgi:hypothetical protein